MKKTNSGIVVPEGTNVVPFAKTNGNEPPKNWLKEMPKGATFLAQIAVKGAEQTVDASEFRVKNHVDTCTLLWQYMYNTDGVRLDIERWVVTENFSEAYRLLEVIRTDG